VPVAPSRTGLPHSSEWQTGMYLRELRLHNFRNHLGSTFEFAPGVNALVGKNGQGKTNVLEAISYLSLTKSFFSAADAIVLRLGEDTFAVDGIMVPRRGNPSAVHVGYDRRSEQKTYAVNTIRQERLASVIGMFPIVVLSPEKNGITFGGPAERRKFLDVLLSQLSRAYVEDSLEYRRVLRQRNRVLNEAAGSGSIRAGVLDPWTAELVCYGSRIVYRRQQFMLEFCRYVQSAFADLAGSAEESGLRYVSACAAREDVSQEAVAAAMTAELDRRRDEEWRRGVSLVGPHRDDLALTINGLEIQRYASQGQHKTFLVALKIAEFHFLRERKEEEPLFLLDDVFSELDGERSGRMLRLVAGLGQTFITTTENAVLGSELPWDSDNRRYFIEQGTARPA